MPRLKQNKINTVYSFTVEGKGDFPTDMLRYDRCWPANQGEILDWHYHGRSSEISTRRQEVRKVNLTSYQEPTEGRWNSFGWKIVNSHSRDVS